MERFVVRDGNRASSTAGSVRRRTSPESTTESRSTSSAPQLPTAKRSKPRPGLSSLNLHKESRPMVHGLARRSVVGSGSSSSLLVNRHGERGLSVRPNRQLDILLFEFLIFRKNIPEPSDSFYITSFTCKLPAIRDASTST